MAGRAFLIHHENLQGRTTPTRRLAMVVVSGI